MAQKCEQVEDLAAPLSPVRLVVVPGNSREVPSESRGPARFKWWPAYACGRNGVVQASQGKGWVQRLRGCNCRACVSCHRAKLEAWVSGAGELVAQPNERLYHVRLTPKDGQARTREQVESFIGQVGELFKTWRKRHGLGAAWWVAEVARREDAGRSELPCPIRLGVPDGEFGGWEPGLVEDVHALTRRCQAGSCHLCGGTGFLPEVHLHVHAVVVAPRFWYTAEARQKYGHLAAFADFSSFGLHGGFTQFAASFGLGNVQPERLRSGAGMRQYISKACLQYISKGNDEDTGRKGRQVDHDASQLGAELAAAVYGDVQSRQKVGRARGLKKREKLAGRVAYVDFAARPDDREEPAAFAAARGDLGRQVKVKAARRADEAMLRAFANQGQAEQLGPLVEVLGVGRGQAAEALGQAGAELVSRSAQDGPVAVREARAALAMRARAAETYSQKSESGAGQDIWVPSEGRGTSSVPEGTQSDGDVTGYARERSEGGPGAPVEARARARVETSEPTLGEPDTGWPVVWGDGGPRRAGSAQDRGHLARAWSGVPVVGGEDWWTWARDGGVLLGRGETLIFVPDFDPRGAAGLVAIAQALRLESQRQARERRDARRRGERCPPVEDPWAGRPWPVRLWALLNPEEVP